MNFPSVYFLVCTIVFCFRILFFIRFSEREAEPVAFLFCFSEREAEPVAFGRARDYERVHGESGLWRGALAFGKVGERSWMGGLGSKHLELVNAGR